MTINITKMIKVLIFAMSFIAPHTVFAQLIVPVDSNAAELLEGRDLAMENDLDKKDLVPTKEIALQLAEIYATNFYGEREVSHQKPYLIADNIYIDKYIIKS